MNKRLAKRLVLVGAGHAHARVLQDFAQQPVAGLTITLVSSTRLAPYSGMMPGWLAGHYRWEECCIDFAALCRQAGATLVEDDAINIDSAASELVLQSGARLAFDRLSLNIGATLTPPASAGVMVLPMRPLTLLHERWHALLAHVCTLAPRTRFRVTMVGGGVAGVESMLAAQHRLTRLAPQVDFKFALASGNHGIVPGLAPGAVTRLHAQLKARGIDVVHAFHAERLADHAVVSSSGHTIATDVALWATGAQAYAWLRDTNIALNEQGFIRIDSTLRSVSHPAIFAAGDCAGWHDPLPKAGVFAVRMGPVLSRNLRASLQDDALATYRPQRHHLVLVGTGDAHAVGSWGPLAWQGRWMWKWKEIIDRRFIRRYSSPNSINNVKRETTC